MVRPVLYSDDAVDLLMGTAAQESQLGTWLRQIGGGPALGAFQMEPDTFRWLQAKFATRFSEICSRYHADLEWDLDLAILMARLRYRVVPAALPKAGDLTMQAPYWKQHYNTTAGAGTVEQFVHNYRLFVSC